MTAGLTNRTRFFVTFLAALGVGVGTGVIGLNWPLSILAIVVVVLATAPLTDRRIVGLTSDSVVQATSEAFRYRPSRLLPPIELSAIEVASKSGRTTRFRINGAVYLGGAGADELAAALISRKV